MNNQRKKIFKFKKLFWVNKIQKIYYYKYQNLNHLINNNINNNNKYKYSNNNNNNNIVLIIMI